MTTITIDAPLQLEKTKFATPLEAAYFLMKQQMRLDHDTYETPANVFAYEQSLSQQHEQFLLSEAKKLVL